MLGFFSLILTICDMVMYNLHWLGSSEFYSESKKRNF